MNLVEYSTREEKCKTVHFLRNFHSLQMTMVNVLLTHLLTLTAVECYAHAPWNT